MSPLSLHKQIHHPRLEYAWTGEEANLEIIGVQIAQRERERERERECVGIIIKGTTPWGLEHELTVNAFII
jgi:hypothetical protein